LLKGTSRFGAEFDSLSDFLCFGVAPALVLYLWTLEGWRGAGYAPCLLFAVCAALRLARFNSALDAGPGPAYRQHFFTGVPAPAGAMLALFPLFAALAAAEWRVVPLASALSWPGLSAFVLVGVGGLMVSTLPTWAFKNFRVPEPVLLPMLIGVGLYAAFLVSEPWGALALGGLAYMAMLPFSLRSYRRLKAEAEAIAEPVVAAQLAER
jgi:CDP-diacylglycerol--serine O-phosphatidyltransferase